jgi:hypothetical protein
MSDPENFLLRWSRRKREVLRETERPDPPARAANAPAEDNHPSGDAAHPGLAPVGLPFDPAGLPSIHSITAETDIRGFLGAGVPPELTRAALRRAWACDPAIRNFVGLADYDWDFNAANSIAGFGPLRMTDDAAKMAAQVLEPKVLEPKVLEPKILEPKVLEPRRTEPGPCNLPDPAPTIPQAGGATHKADIGAARSAATEMHDHATDREQPANEIGAPAHADELTHGEQGRVAVQYTSAKPENSNVLVRRRHGGALPK